MPKLTQMNFPLEHLENFTKNILLKIGCPENDAEVATKVLLSADF
jgi:LDH2 family malate/lactate/ureidoglycolate dehydrogenase